MSRLERLNHLLANAFPSATFEVLDDSADHAGHGHGFSGETHYRVQIVYEGFRGHNTLAVHRQILAAVRPETDAGMHSFVIERAEAPQE